jgi:hypothetical protein
MKKQIAIITAVAGLFAVNELKAQDAPKEEFKPSGKLWGYTFGDISYKAHADSAGRNSNNTQYSGSAKGQSSFEFRRIYLGYDYQISPKISTQFLLAQESLTEVQNGLLNATQVQLGSDNKRVMYIKLANIKMKDVLPHTDLVVGQSETPSFPMLTEKVWGYRSIERTVLDMHRGGSNDLGIMVQGRYNDGGLGYNLMIANGSGAQPEGNIFKKFYADVFYYIVPKKLVFDIYADYERSALDGSASYATGNALAPLAANPTTVVAPLAAGGSRSTYKAFLAYTTPKLTVGVESYIQNIQNGVKYSLDATSAVSYQNVSIFALSLYATGTIIENKLRAFARYDIYNPNTKHSEINQTNVNNKTLLTAISGFNVNNTENFVTAGLDFMPHPNVHFMPNVWYNSYKNRSSAATGLATSDYDLVYRMTFYYVFGK